MEINVERLGCPKGRAMGAYHARVARCSFGRHAESRMKTKSPTRANVPGRFELLNPLGKERTCLKYDGRPRSAILKRCPCLRTPLFARPVRTTRMPFEDWRGATD